MLFADGARRLRAMLAGVPAVEEYVAVMSAPGALTAALNWYRAMTGRDLRGLGPITLPTTYVWSTADVALGAAGALRCGNHVAADYRFVQLDGVSH